ncbi:anaerobic ribonucleoside-triphosphate reductase activating protein [Candidatus Woesearchaeota archaeon]|jgi:pyruvate formate lyase activating enzyme|nr:anaerobic ribonucleoside-triphosphate reductase activating protein [Candidatus Woesearchaeota archaeon]MBT7928710.1 anaerobic ribonucleoside-triphosphate reductase activating protein [Candidatus Peregrinibacteria bacterium]MBT4368099.1 anaerobic ribonucleoside-triphosphate reductase activating protein [Candidatus Woesearchaeota archaeon]MBT4712587.1 anaerobic ribonucleoside-triphosphate reductase activating protein [Candidatus Woesearchaeota archaeon]MBT6639500.1 anaerobic ribonucleoside-tri
MNFGNISSSVDLVSFSNAEEPTTVLFYQGCNFGCGYCHNSNLWHAEDDTLTEKGLNAVLSTARSRWVKLVNVSGGEPTEQFGNLWDLTGYLKQQGFKVKLDTNGSHPEVLETLLEYALVDYAAMDIKGTLAQYPEITGFSDVEKIRNSIELVQFMGNQGFGYEFRTTAVPGIHGESEIREIGEMLRGSRRYAIQQFRPDLDGGCLNPQFCKKESYPGETLREFAEVVKDDFETVIVRARD